VVGAFSDTVFSCLVGSWARQDGLNAMVAHIRDDHIPGWMICECVAHFDVVEAHVGDKLRHGHQPMDLVDSQVFDVAACHFHTLAPAFSDFFTYLKDSITQGGACSTLPPFGALTGSQARRPSCAMTDERWSALENGFRIEVSNIEQLQHRLCG
jgi:hypothetical protein